MRTAATIAGFLLICVGMFGVAWMFPFFTLNEPYFSWYGELLFGPSFSRPGGPRLGEYSFRTKLINADVEKVWISNFDAAVKEAKRRAQRGNGSL